MRKLLFVAMVVLTVPAMALPAGAGVFPEEISLPDGFRPEGIAIGSEHTFYAGSLGDGAIVAGDLRTGDLEVLVPGQEDRIAVGMSFDARSGYLFVAGGTNGVGRVYDTTAGTLLAEYPMGGGGDFGDFINDVVVTRDAAYFTNSFAPVFYRVPLGPAGSLPDPSQVETIALSGDWVQVPGPFVFNANGIEATPNGDRLIVVGSAAQAVYAVDPASGEAAQIDLGGALPNGDGLMLAGKTLYVVQNQLNQIGVISLSADLAEGTLGEPITDPAFDIPTTAARFGDSLYVVNARFGTPPTPTTEYSIVEVPAR